MAAEQENVELVITNPYATRKAMLTSRRKELGACNLLYSGSDGAGSHRIPKQKYARLQSDRSLRVLVLHARHLLFIPFFSVQVSRLSF